MGGIREFVGQLDTPKVKEFTGELDASTDGPSMGPSEMSPDQITKASYAESNALESQENSKIPMIQRDSFHEKSIPILGAASSLLAPGAGWGALGLQSVLAGLGGGGGELIRQQQTREPIAPMEAVKVGAGSAAGNAVGGTVIKGLGAVAKKIFSSPLNDPAKAAASFAKEKGLPFPLSSAAPGTGAAMTQQASRALLPGEIRTQIDANKVAQFLNREVGTITQAGKPIDDAAARGQQFLRTVFEPGETVYTQTFQKLRSTVGDDTAIPLTNTLPAMERVSQALKERGEMKAVYNRLRNILKSSPAEQTAQQVDELYSGLLKDTARNANARREANVVLNALAEDAEGVSKQFGFSFLDDLSKAKKVRDEFRSLRDIPGLERLAKDFGEKGGTLGSRQWMSELFANPNGKALAELRARNPDLYHELADSWLANHLNRFSRYSDTVMGRTLDGTAFRTWFEQNQGALKTIFGAPQTQALDNFSNYAQHMSGAVQRAGKTASPTEMMFRGGSEAAAIAYKPMIAIPGEAASYVLAKGLSDPTSTLFRLFTQGFSAPTKAVMRRSGQAGGQAVGRDQVIKLYGEEPR